MRSSAGNYDSDRPTNQFGRQRRQPFELIFTPRVFDRDVHLVNEADILQASVKPGNLIGERIGGRSGVEKADRRYGSVLGTQRKRPCGRTRREADQVSPVDTTTVH